MSASLTAASSQKEAERKQVIVLYSPWDTAAHGGESMPQKPAGTGTVPGGAQLTGSLFCSPGPSHN